MHSIQELTAFREVILENLAVEGNDPSTLEVTPDKVISYHIAIS